LIRLVVKLFMPPGMPPFTFLILGILPWQTFLHTYKGVEKIISRNKKLLAFPIVTPLDIVFAKALQVLCTYSVVFLGLMVLASYMENSGTPAFPMGIILLYLASWLMGMCFGLFLVPLHRMFPPIRWMLTPITRVGMYTSGLYFVMTSMPQQVWPYMTWNPMLHVDELMRQYWFTTYTSPVASPLYIVECLGGMALFGLLLERFIRRVPA
jgi:capsular polysaccharide transport system permease protein